MLEGEALVKVRREFELRTKAPRGGHGGHGGRHAGGAGTAAAALLRGHGGGGQAGAAGRRSDHRGLTLPEFVQVICRHLPLHRGGAGLRTGDGDACTTKEALVSHLCDLFDRIDVNGDGSLEWGEFTSFCVEACGDGMPSGPAPLRFRLHDSGFADHASRGTIAKALWVPQLQRSLVCEGEGAALKLYDPACRLAAVLVPTARMAARTEPAPHHGTGGGTGGGGTGGGGTRGGGTGGGGGGAGHAAAARGGSGRLTLEQRLEWETRQAAAMERRVAAALERAPEGAESAPAVCTAVTYLSNATPPQVAIADSRRRVTFWATDPKRLTPDIFEPFGAPLMTLGGGGGGHGGHGGGGGGGGAAMRVGQLLWCAENRTLYMAAASSGGMAAGQQHEAGRIMAWRGGPGAGQRGDCQVV